MRPSFSYVSCLVCILQVCGVICRGQRINIFSQDGGSDMSQMRTVAKSKSVMYNVLPRNSPLKWSKTRDSSGNFIIPYMISGRYDPSERSIIADAMGRIEANTCIRFKKRTFERDYIDLQNTQNEGCYTNVGRMSGKNVVMLEANEMATCVEVDIVVHELFHAIGLWHEHMRYDRDDFISVHYENIDPIYMSQFEKISSQESTTYGVPYDYKSVMHYAEDAFARKGRISMETKDPQYQKVIGNQKDASPSDYKKVCILYGCQTCMGEDIDSNNPAPTSLPVVPEVESVLPAVTYTPVGPPSACREIFSIFCQRQARRNRLDCNYFTDFCQCTCQELSRAAPPLQPRHSRGFFDRVWGFFG